ncbi:MAG: hypothetical protein RI885_1333 [Actinomycetota bacterium]
MITTTSTAVRIDGVSKRFPGRRGQSTLALSPVSLDIADGEFLCILGRSGCGKSTLLNLIAGLEQPSTGTIDLGGRRVGVMFQDANLFPWLTVDGNIRLALSLSGFPAADRRARIDELLATVELSGHGDSRPHELSGGMRQRVALARTLAQDCQVLLMDEPFAALDAITRDVMHAETERIAAERSLTVVFVTHNVREAARLADRVVIMRPGPGRIGSISPIDIVRPRRMEDPAVSESAAMLSDRLHHHDIEPGDE